jgi:hypothetical protein
MRTFLAVTAVVTALAVTASAQTALAPWFDADGFYNRPGVDLARATNDMTACRAEAARLKTVRNTRTQVGHAAAFDASGAYDPVVSGAATGIASIMFAIQDSRYNGSIEQIEFRDCAVALGYRHFRTADADRVYANSVADHGFASLVAAETPSIGRLNNGESARNYFAADVTPSRYQNAAPRPVEAPVAPPAPEVVAEDGVNEVMPVGVYRVPAPLPPPGIIARAAPGQTLSPQPGMAIVVLSASQLSGAMQMPVAGDTVRFTRVTADGAFLDLLQPSHSFGARSHMNSERRQDPTLAGEFRTPRYSTYQIPAGRYVLSNLGSLNACLGTLTFEVREGDVAYLGDFVLRPPNLPTGSLFNPLGNINSGMDNRLRSDLRVGIGDNLEAARAGRCWRTKPRRRSSPAWPTRTVTAFHARGATSAASATMLGPPSPAPSPQPSTTPWRRR